MAQNKTTIHDIARALNVTASTVSRALNGNAAISEGTRTAVVKMARQLNYRPNRIAAALRSGRSHTVGIVVPYADRNIFSSIIRGMEEGLSKANYSVIICQTYDDQEQEEQALDTLLRLRVDGIMASIAKKADTYQHYERVKEAGIPLIFYDNHTESITASHVVIDDFLGGYRAASHLIEQGCRRIAHFAGQQRQLIYSERSRGYRQALRDNGLDYDTSIVRESISDVGVGYQLARELFTLPNPPDALFSTSDYAALGALQYCKDHGIAVPRQMAIVGFANESFTSFIEPGLSTVDQKSREMGANAARVFLEEIDDSIPARHHSLILEPSLIIRASSLRV